MTLDNSNNYVIEKDNSKRSRKYNAVKLPLQLNETMIPKYVVYYKECYNREKQLYREFFKIEKHPKIQTKKIYTSSKSNTAAVFVDSLVARAYSPTRRSKKFVFPGIEILSINGSGFFDTLYTLLRKW